MSRLARFQHGWARLALGLPLLLLVLGACQDKDTVVVVDPGTIWEIPSWSPAPYEYGLRTRFAANVAPDSALPEYPRMQLRRDDWLNLNGVWQFREQAGKNEAVPSGQNLAQGILVPFPVESALSGVKEDWDRVWYRRVFTVPETWSATDRVLLNFGAVDFEAEVFVNGMSVGLHEGGYDQFTVDITDALKGSRTTQNQELIVRVYDPTNTARNPVGKQSNDPGGIFYTSTTGIWQTVWLEPVPAAYITGLRMTPDIDTAQLELTVATSGAAENATVDVTVSTDDETIVTLAGQRPNEAFVVDIPDQRLWSPVDPFLYDLQVTLHADDQPQDIVDSYFGMRKVSIEPVDGYQQVFLNNEPLFQRGVLDQGYWPDGIYTAPTDEALKWDIQTVLDLGLNVDRKHVKREPDRWYYWADKLGLLVWQDMVPLAENFRSDAAYPQWQTEMQETMAELHNHPAIIQWVLYNEGWGEPNQDSTNAITEQAKAIDPSRVITQASGWTDFGGGDVLDWHCYPGPCAPDGTERVNINGEYGGISYELNGHLWKPEERFAYPGQVYNTADYLQSYGLKTSQLFGWAEDRGLNGYIYTQLTDVETERNGLVTYDREVIKAPAADLAQLNTDPPAVTMLANTAIEAPVKWRYVTRRPDDNWYASYFDDSGWSEGESGFGSTDSPSAKVRTPWNTSNIWLRRTFELDGLTAEDLQKLHFKINHDDEMEIYLNGLKVAEFGTYVSSYTFAPLSHAAQVAINPDGPNLLAVHVRQTQGGQYADVGIGLFGE